MIPAGPDRDIHICGAREHNLRNIEVRIPRHRLTVITGVSGSGKSSLAFDTLYAEGYRKYMESLSTRARQVLEQLPHPEVDFIHGLSPVLAIEQRTSGGNPRSTVGTVTEIADYARLWWARQGKAFCPLDGGEIVQRTTDDLVESLLDEPEGTKLILLAPQKATKAAVLIDELEHLRQKGFQRIRVNGEIRRIDEPKVIPAGKGPVQMEIVIDRLVLRANQRSRLADSLELALSEGEDRAIALIDREGNSEFVERTLSRNLACAVCGTVYPPLTPRTFSWNTREGACPECDGLGRKMIFVAELVVPDPRKSIKEGAIKPLRIGGKQLIIRHNAILKQLAEQYPFDPKTPWQDLPAEVRTFLLQGDRERIFTFKLRGGKRAKPREETFPGVLAILEKSARETSSEGYRARLTTFQRSEVCPSCGGSRLNPLAGAVRVEGITFPEFFGSSLDRALEIIEQQACLKEAGDRIQEDVWQGLRERLRFLTENGLGYLQLNREYSTLSGGEAQRVRLATQLGMGLVGVTYVLDEPSIGLHPVDNTKLWRSLADLRDRGNTVVVVEHDEEAMRAADWLIELGPGAGQLGGHLLYSGPADKLEECADSLTGPYLTGREFLGRSVPRRAPDDRWLFLQGARLNNLRKDELRIPVGLMTGVAGVSGSGKSSLITDTLARAAAMRLQRAQTLPGPYDRLEGLDYFDKVVEVDQTPIGRTPRSNPATFTKLFDLLRTVYSQCPLSKVRGYKPGRFSFNMRGGRCEKCQGDGMIKVDMQFMADAYMECPSCRGQRYNRETLEVKFKGYSIAEVLDMTVREAADLFRAFPKVMEKLDTLIAVGLDYLKLGQPAPTLSGGEAQRLKLSLELSRKQQGRTLYILDEPTTGLHWVDIQKLLDLLGQLRESGNTIIVIEHHPEFLSQMDWIVEMGPGGGDNGGRIIFSGKPEDLQKCQGSPTGPFLRFRHKSGK